MLAAAQDKTRVVPAAALLALADELEKGKRKKTAKRLRAMVEEQGVDLPAALVAGAGPRGSPLIAREEGGILGGKPIFDGQFARAVRAQVRGKIEKSAADFVVVAGGGRP